MDLVAKTFQGLEDVLAEELVDLGATDVTKGRRMVSFKGDKTLLYKANFCCRTALKILKPIHTFKADDADQLYEAAKTFEWDKLLTPDQTFAIDSTVYSEDFRHSKFVTYRVKDAIADFFMEKYGKRPSIRLMNADMLLNVHISNNDVTISLDSSGESLHKRGYRVAQTEAPINEVLAAGLLKMAGWKGESNLIDPMCGSGTFLIEAALIAANINPGVFRQSFAFERWRDFEPEILDEIYNDDSQERDFNFKIYGSDISPKAIAITQRNIKSAGVGKYIDLKVQPFQQYEEAPENCMLITNPPYGERLEADDIDRLYESIGEKLKKVFKGYHAWIISEKTEFFDKIGLKPSVKIPVLNGAIECEFREYVMFDGSYDNFRKEGNSIKDGNRRREFQKRNEERKPEWKNQSDRFNRKFDRKENEGKFERDRRGRERELPKNALEEKYHRRYSDRFNDSSESGDRFKKFDGERPFKKRDDFKRDDKFKRDERKPRPQKRQSVFGDKKVDMAVQFRKPKLFDESDLDKGTGETVMRHRHKKTEED